MGNYSRDIVATALTAALEDISVYPQFPLSLGQITEPSIYVQQQKVEPSNIPSWWSCTLQALVVSPRTGETANDDIDNLLNQLLIAIDEIEGIQWTAANRATFEEEYPAYQVELTVTVERSSS